MENDAIPGADDAGSAYRPASAEVRAHVAPSAQQPGSGQRWDGYMPAFLGRESKRTGPVPLVYEGGEFWVHCINADGSHESSPFMVQQEDENLHDFIERVHAVEAAIS